MPHPYALEPTAEAEVASPALLFYPELIRRNVAWVVAAAGGPTRLRPHVKTHKTREVTRMQLDAGVTRHKCATLAEAEVLAEAGAPDVLIAYPVVGPNAARLTHLAGRFHQTQFSAVVDSPEGLAGLAAAAKYVKLGAFLDLNVGMDRTGVPVNDTAACAKLYGDMARMPNLIPRGLHAYDGHNHQGPARERAAAAKATLAPVLALRDHLNATVAPCELIVAGGTPTFPAYAAMVNVPHLECSPGTYVLHDHNYGSRFSDFDGVAPAALLLTRVISRPTATRVTLDLGHKAVAADQSLDRRVKLLNVPDYTIVGQSEEHLVIETSHAAEFPVGRVLYGVPGHVCPTVALHRDALTVENHRVTGRWPIAARDRDLRE